MSKVSGKGGMCRGTSTRRVTLCSTSKVLATAAPSRSRDKKCDGPVMWWTDAGSGHLPDRRSELGNSKLNSRSN